MQACPVAQTSPLIGKLLPVAQQGRSNSKAFTTNHIQLEQVQIPCRPTHEGNSSNHRLRTSLQQIRGMQTSSYGHDSPHIQTLSKPDLGRLNSPLAVLLPLSKQGRQVLSRCKSWQGRSLFPGFARCIGVILHFRRCSVNRIQFFPGGRPGCRFCGCGLLRSRRGVVCVAGGGVSVASAVAVAPFAI